MRDGNESKERLTGELAMLRLVRHSLGLYLAENIVRREWGWF